MLHLCMHVIKYFDFYQHEDEEVTNVLSLAVCSPNGGEHVPPNLASHLSIPHDLSAVIRDLLKIVLQGACRRLA